MFRRYQHEGVWAQVSDQSRIMADGEGMLVGVDSFYADAENGTYVAGPSPAGLLSLVNALNASDNTFVVLYPTEPVNEWYLSVATSRKPFGGYEIERHDPATGEKATTTGAVPGQIVTDALAWVADR